MKPYLIALVLLGIALTADQAQAQFAPKVQQYISVEAPVVAITNVKLIDGTGGVSQTGQTILIREGTIQAVGATGEVEIPSDAHRIDGTNQTVIPGFVGLHNHMYYMVPQRSGQISYSSARLYLASGVTTIRTTGSFAPYAEINLRYAIEAGQEVGPTIHNTGPYITGGQRRSGFMRELADAEEARRVVRYWVEEGVTWFKAYTHITQAALGAAIDEAHKHGIKVTAHLCSVTFQEAVALGIDALEHGFLTDTGYDAEKESDACPLDADYQKSLRVLEAVDLEGDAVQSTIQAMVENDVAMTFTAAVFETSVPGRPPVEQRMLTALAPEMRDFVKSMNEQFGDTYSMAEALFKKALQFDYKFVQAGGLLAAGVDPGGMAMPGYGDQRNYELLLEAGFTPVQAIQIMTANGAKVLEIEDQVGTIAPGKRADLVLIAGDPELRPAEIRNVAQVFKAGIGYDAAKLVESVKGLVGIE